MFRPSLLAPYKSLGLTWTARKSRVLSLNSVRVSLPPGGTRTEKRNYAEARIIGKHCILCACGFVDYKIQPYYSIIYPAVQCIRLYLSLKASESGKGKEKTKDKNVVKKKQGWERPGKKKCMFTFLLSFTENK